MLVLSRKVREAVVIGDQVVVTVVAVHGKRVRLGVTAPPGVPVRRAELVPGPAPVRNGAAGRGRRPGDAAAVGAARPVSRGGRALRGLIESAAAGLPALEREVLLLSDLEGLPEALVGARLGLGRAALKRRLHRARRMMCRALAPHLLGPAP